MNMSLGEVKVDDGHWHNLTLASVDRVLRILLDGKPAGEELEVSSVHDFLDAYLTSLTLGAAPHFSPTFTRKLLKSKSCPLKSKFDPLK